MDRYQTKRHFQAENGRTYPVEVRRHPRARRITLHVNPVQDRINLTIPRYVSSREGFAFLESKRSWLLEALEALPEKTYYRDGVQLPLFGTRYTIRHRPEEKGKLYIEGKRICVPGEAEHLPRRVRAFLKDRARRELDAMAREKAHLINKRVCRVSVRDTRSRWGSCSSEGNLSFCWRLIFAPPRVTEYVVAHEVAHLRHLDHSERFWNLVESICPGYKRYKTWLRTQGTKLYRYE